MSETPHSDSDCAGPDTDFDSLFVIGEADQSVLVAKQQQQVNFVSRHHGSGYNSPNRGSPARRTQVIRLLINSGLMFFSSGRGGKIRFPYFCGKF